MGFGKKHRDVKPKAKHIEPPPTEACLEIEATSLGTQERMQAILREKRWNVGEEDASESFWSFIVYLDKGTLVAYTKPDPAAERVDWRSGKAVVVVNSLELGDGYTRVSVSARFEGYGESDDKFAPQRNGWILKSNGELERSLILALRDRFRVPH